MLVTSGVCPIMEMEDRAALLGSSLPPRATDFSIAAIIGRSGRAAEVLSKMKGKGKIGNNIKPLRK